MHSNCTLLVVPLPPVDDPHPHWPPRLRSPWTVLNRRATEARKPEGGKERRSEARRDHVHVMVAWRRREHERRLGPGGGGGGEQVQTSRGQDETQISKLFQILVYDCLCLVSFSDAIVKISERGSLSGLAEGTCIGDVRGLKFRESQHGAIEPSAALMI
eukprot:754567-Hanusia_phi.AAC.2